MTFRGKIHSLSWALQKGFKIFDHYMYLEFPWISHNAQENYLQVCKCRHRKSSWHLRGISSPTDRTHQLYSIMSYETWDMITTNLQKGVALGWSLQQIGVTKYSIIHLYLISTSKDVGGYDPLSPRLSGFDRLSLLAIEEL